MDNYKKKYWNLIKHLRWMAKYKLKCEKCPPMYMRKCCNGCNDLLNFLDRYEKKGEENGDYVEENKD